ncbi:MAG: Glutamyl-Q tRNA(Asp) synthetase [Candidatus Erwinia impunctatus]|nr:Glutamyl-Q tRNA(Asp) synthetase [Culicoides impunctatus]
MQYIGRFAPSPSGELHFGSLIAALGSYLSARAARGKWLIRIEDIDPPREVPGAATRILQQLEHYGLYWDGEVLWQSDRHQAYREILHTLASEKRSYACTCTRKRIRDCGGFYDRHCRHRHYAPEDAAIRLINNAPFSTFEDRLRGEVRVSQLLAEEDFIIHRRDGLFAYNLAVVVDDHFQGITDVVRGGDLIAPTARQLTLYHQCHWTPPSFLHLPLALSTDGNKLSKQNHAPPLPDGDPRPAIISTLRFLGQPVDPLWRDLPLNALLEAAVASWDIASIPENNVLSPLIPDVTG